MLVLDGVLQEHIFSQVFTKAHMISVDLASNSITIADPWGKPRGVPLHVVGRRGSLSDRSRSIRVATSNVAGVYPVTMHLLGSRVHHSP